MGNIKQEEQKRHPHGSTAVLAVRVWHSRHLFDRRKRDSSFCKVETSSFWYHLLKKVSMSFGLASVGKSYGSMCLRCH